MSHFAKKNSFTKKPITAGAKPPAKKPITAGAKPSVTKKPLSIVLSNEYRSAVCAASYLGKKGYTILREALSPEDQEFLHKDLFVKPAVMGPQYGPPDTEVAFPVYRENPKKIYIPRFYGIARYGMPTRSEITPGDDISVEFAKPLRDYQDKIIGIYTDHVKAGSGGGILEVPCGRGKCLGKDTPILMYNGTIKLVQDVVVGDVLMGDDSTPRNVLTLARGKEMMYNINSEKDGKYRVNESHILSLKNRKNEILDISVSDYLKLPESNDWYGYRVPIVFQDKYLEMDPYLFGSWIGDGSKMESIPLHYKCNSRKKQLELLVGIVKSTGTYYNNNNCYEIIQTNEILLDDITYVARSLGFKVYKRILHEPFTDVIYYSVSIYGKQLQEILVNICTRDNNLATNYPVCEDLTYELSVSAAGIDEYYGFEIDGNRRFVLGDFTVTHNTVMALKIISLLKKKTLIIVHKEFLMNQWIERAQEFLPSARIGKIQGPVFDVEGKDIVLGMLQTLYDREFPEGAFDSFGLTIVDEVHRIGSEQFSKSLLRIITPYMLGISATVDRKDGLTKIIYMFMGDKIYTEKREDEDPVCVRALEYISSDTAFNEVEYDFRGNPKYSTMISKLCEYGPRSDFIVRVLNDLVQENGEAQIMVLCHNRSLLKYLFESVNHKGFATVGYYVGGMKQIDLQETEGKKIVLATYAMAAEALDIKTLSILLMATPKTDITQSVGRILRVRHDNPVVVDIVDRHDIFQNQWRQRKTFYRKCNYRIRSMDSVRYKGMDLDWKTDRSWTQVFDPRVSGGGGDATEKKEFKCLISMDDLEN